jgi:hypothetical protein
MLRVVIANHHGEKDTRAGCARDNVLAVAGMARSYRTTCDKALFHKNVSR